MKVYSIIFLCSFGFFTTSAQLKIKTNDAEKQKIIEEADSIYQSNIKKARLNGVYIPKDLNDAFLELDRLSPPESLAKIKTVNEQTVAKKLHFGLGRWMSHNWNFDEGSRFSHFLQSFGLYNSDDMIEFMLISYHRYLTNHDLDSQTLSKSILEKRKKINEVHNH